MKRLTITFAVLFFLLFADGTYMQARRYRLFSDQNTFFGNPHLILSDGQVVLISAGLMALATVVTFVLWQVQERRGSSTHGR
ncbi:MAG TPA: hypothetical protein VGS19_18360 [Streptosporangiaceae bacterium]|nr:hypothetical protein [Streptosporangiaceae bacterium]